MRPQSVLAASHLAVCCAHASAFFAGPEGRGDGPASPSSFGLSPARSPQQQLSALIFEPGDVGGKAGRTLSYSEEYSPPGPSSLSAMLFSGGENFEGESGGENYEETPLVPLPSTLAPPPLALMDRIIAEDRIGQLARIAAAYSPPERPITVDIIQDVLIAGVGTGRIELVAMVCDEVSMECLSHLVPVAFMGAAPTVDLCKNGQFSDEACVGCLIRELEELDPENTVASVEGVAEPEAAVLLRATMEEGEWDEEGSDETMLDEAEEVSAAAAATPAAGEAAAAEAAERKAAEEKAAAEAAAAEAAERKAAEEKAAAEAAVAEAAERKAAEEKAAAEAAVAEAAERKAAEEKAAAAAAAVAEAADRRAAEEKAAAETTAVEASESVAKEEAAVLLRITSKDRKGGEERSDEAMMDGPMLDEAEEEPEAADVAAVEAAKRKAAEEKAAAAAAAVAEAAAAEAAAAEAAEKKAAEEKAAAVAAAEAAKRAAQEEAKMKEWKKSTAAHYAAKVGALDTIRGIVDVNDVGMFLLEDSNGWQPLHEAARGGFTEIAEILIEHGADVNARSNGGRGASPLWLVTNCNGEDHPLAKIIEKRGGKEIAPESADDFISSLIESCVVPVRDKNEAKAQLEEAKEDQKAFKPLYVDEPDREVIAKRKAVAEAEAEEANRIAAEKVAAEEAAIEEAAAKADSKAKRIADEKAAAEKAAAEKAAADTDTEAKRIADKKAAYVAEMKAKRIAEEKAALYAALEKTAADMATAAAETESITEERDADEAKIEPIADEKAPVNDAAAEPEPKGFDWAAGPEPEPKQPVATKKGTTEDKKEDGGKFQLWTTTSASGNFVAEEVKPSTPSGRKQPRPRTPVKASAPKTAASKAKERPSIRPVTTSVGASTSTLPARSVRGKPRPRTAVDASNTQPKGRGQGSESNAPRLEQKGNKDEGGKYQLWTANSASSNIVAEEVNPSPPIGKKQPRPRTPVKASIAKATVRKAKKQPLSPVQAFISKPPAGSGRKQPRPLTSVAGSTSKAPRADPEKKKGASGNYQLRTTTSASGNFVAEEVRTAPPRGRKQPRPRTAAEAPGPSAPTGTDGSSRPRPRTGVSEPVMLEPTSSISSNLNVPPSTPNRKRQQPRPRTEVPPAKE